MMCCSRGSWKLRCIKQYKIGYVTFDKGNTYEVKDKFPGEDQNINSGVWEVKNGHGGLVDISKEIRDEYFDLM